MSGHESHGGGGEDFHAMEVARTAAKDTIVNPIEYSILLPFLWLFTALNHTPIAQESHHGGH
jgi:hypothetical protein